MVLHIAFDDGGWTRDTLGWGVKVEDVRPAVCYSTPGGIFILVLHEKLLFSRLNGERFYSHLYTCTCGREPKPVMKTTSYLLMCHVVKGTPLCISSIVHEVHRIRSPARRLRQEEQKQHNKHGTTANAVYVENLPDRVLGPSDIM